jgi:hypothetical protein
MITDNRDHHVLASKSEALSVVLYETRVCNANVTLPQIYFPAGLWGGRLQGLP